MGWRTCTTIRLLAHTKLANKAPAKISVGQWAVKYTLESAIDAAGTKAAHNHKKRQRCGCCRLASTPSTKKNAKPVTLWPLGKLKLCKGSSSTAGRSLAKKCFSK